MTTKTLCHVIVCDGEVKNIEVLAFNPLPRTLLSIVENGLFKMK